VTVHRQDSDVDLPSVSETGQVPGMLSSTPASCRLAKPAVSSVDAHAGLQGSRDKALQADLYRVLYARASNDYDEPSHRTSTAPRPPMAPRPPRLRKIVTYNPKGNDETGPARLRYTATTVQSARRMWKRWKRYISSLLTLPVKADS